MAEGDISPEQKAPVEKASKKVKVTFTGSPTGLLKLSYSKGDTAMVTKDQRDLLAAAKLIEIK